MKLYYSKGACSLAIRIVIHYLGINCEYEAVDLKWKKTEHGQDFLTINQKGSVPVLVLDNSEVLTENLVIQVYLAEHYKNTQLLPEVGNMKRYRVLEWLNFISTDLHKGCGPLFLPNLSEDIKESVFRPALKKKLQYVNELLNGKPFLLGNNFTLPDSYLFVILTWMPHLGIDYQDCENLVRYFQELQQFPAIKEAVKEEKYIKK